MIWISAILWSLYLSDVDCQSFITLRDEKFEGPDRVLKEELARRQQLRPESAAEVQALLDRSAARPPRRPQQTARDTYAARRLLVKYAQELTMRSQTGNLTKTLQPWTFGDPIMQKTYDLILFLILRVQERLEDLRPILLKYESDPRVRLGHIYCKLDKWKLDLMATYLSVYRFEDRSVDSHLVMYQQLLAKNVDITYTVEYLITIQSYFMEKASKIMTELRRAEMERYREQYKEQLALQQRGAF